MLRAFSVLLFQSSSVTTGLPSVIVPVLSSTTAFIFRAVSRLVASFIRIPFSAPFPIPTIRAVGVASPNAHGHAIIKTVIMARIPCTKPASGAKIHHAANTNTDSAIITGTNTAAILSTSCCTGALLPCASCTMRIICASMVSLPVLAATKRNEPVLFTEPAKTLSPCFLNVGRGSPVSMLSSTYDSPAATVPSAAMRSPGRTIIVQPARACSTGMSFSPVSVRTVTVLGCKPISFLMAVDVFCFARASSRRPRSMKAIIMLADSKYTCGSIPCDSQKPGKKRLNTLNR